MMTNLYRLVLDNPQKHNFIIRNLIQLNDEFGGFSLIWLADFN